MAQITVNKTCILRRLIWCTGMSSLDVPVISFRNLSLCYTQCKTAYFVEELRGLLSKGLLKSVRCQRMLHFTAISALNINNHTFKKTVGSCSQTQYADVTSRHYSHSSSKNRDPFYKFPWIIHFRLIGFFQIYQTGVTTVLLPILMYYFYLGQDTVVSLKTGLEIFGLSVVMLCILNHFVRHTVGQMCLSEDKKTVTISHLNFVGRRKDVQWPVNDIVPISETTNKPDDMWINLQRYSDKQQFYLSLRYGKILNKEDFTHVLGNVYVTPRRRSKSLFGSWKK